MSDARGGSKCGWGFSVAYVAMAGYLFYRAATCSGWVCDLVALPAAFPLGFPIAWVTDWIDSLFLIPGHAATFHFRNSYFIIPTVMANAVFYYWLGKRLEVWVRRWLSAVKGPR